MTDDPPKKEVPLESSLPTAPSITQDAISIENTISRERFAQLSGVEPPQICAAALILIFIATASGLSATRCAES